LLHFAPTTFYHGYDREGNIFSLDQKFPQPMAALELFREHVHTSDSSSLLFTAPEDLLQANESWAKRKTIPEPPVRTSQTDTIRFRERSWSNENHVALNNVPELWELIEVCRTEAGTEWRYFCSITIHHRSEFQQFERLALVAHSFLNEQYWFIWIQQLQQNA
jgi:hypothetical protein